MKPNELKKRLLQFLGLTVLKFLVSALVKTYRIKFVNADQPDQLLNNGEKIVAAFWHGTMLVPWFIHRNKKFSALVSRSKDGEILASVLKRWNYRVIRGSSHVGGKEALKLLTDTVDEGCSAAITPDGPTGPARKFKPGAVVLAKRKNIPLFLVGTASAEKKILKSWDSFEIPKPFTRVAVCYSNAIKIKNDAEREEIEQVINECEIKLNELQEEAEKIVRNNR